MTTTTVEQWNEFPRAVAIDRVTGALMPKAVGQVYLPGDTNYASPVAITDTAGVPLGQLNSGASGVFPAFRAEGVVAVVLRSGDNEPIPLFSIDASVTALAKAEEAILAAVGVTANADQALAAASEALLVAQGAAAPAIEQIDARIAQSGLPAGLQAVEETAAAAASDATSARSTAESAAAAVGNASSTAAAAKAAADTARDTADEAQTTAAAAELALTGMPVSVRAYGANGSDSGGDRTAIQAAIDANPGGTIIIPDGTYLVSHLTISAPHTTLTGTGTIKATTAGADLLTITADDVTVTGLEFDGAGLARYGIYTTGARTLIERNHIHHFHDTANSARGVFASTPHGVTIRNNDITYITGTTGTLVRGIVMHSTSPCTAASYCVDNYLSDITGTGEADGIALLYSDGTGAAEYLPGHAIVRGNQLRNNGRRYIKVQGSDVTVENNRCWVTDDFVPFNPSFALDLIQGDRVTFQNNRVEDVRLLACLGIAGTDTNYCADVVVRGNYFLRGATTSPLIYAAQADRLTVEGNTLRGGQFYMSGGQLNDLVVHHNRCSGGDLTRGAFSFTSSALGKVVANVLPTGRMVGSGSGITYAGNY